MQEDNSDKDPTIVTTVTEKIEHASPDIARAATIKFVTLKPSQYSGRSVTESLVTELERHMTALTTAVARTEHQLFNQYIQSFVGNTREYEKQRLVIEILGQTMRQQLGEHVWSFTKPVLDPALEWLTAQTSQLDSVQAANAANLVADFTQCILNGNRIRAETLVFDALVQDHNIRDVYIEIIQPSLYEVGRLWEIGQVSIAQENLATAITQSILSSIYTQVELPSNLEQQAIVACLENNFHEIGPRMLADFLQLAGYNTRFLGTNTSLDYLIEMIQTLKPSVIGLPATIQSQVDNVKLAIDRVRSDFSSYRPTIMVGGLAFNHIDGLWKRVNADLWGEDGGRAIDQLVGSSGWV